MVSFFFLFGPPRYTRSCTKGTLSREGFVFQVYFFLSFFLFKVTVSTVGLRTHLINIFSFPPPFHPLLFGLYFDSRKQSYDSRDCLANPDFVTKGGKKKKRTFYECFLCIIAVCSVFGLRGSLTELIQIFKKKGAWRITHKGGLRVTNLFDFFGAFGSRSTTCQQPVNIDPSRSTIFLLFFKSCQKKGVTAAC